ncbi:MAG: permease [Pseudomonadota bacterium]
MTAAIATLRRWGGEVKIDRVWLAFALILLVLGLYDLGQAQEGVAFTLNNMVTTGPYLLVSILVAAYATATGADGQIAKIFEGREAAMITLAALFGGLSPFCSCGVIPLIAALLAMGVPLAPVMAFWLASPVIDPAQFVMTVGTLGTEFAVAKTIAAVSLGFFGGFGTLALVRSGFLTNPLREGVGNGGCGGSKVRNPKPPVWRFWDHAERREKFGREAYRSGMFLFKWLALAFLLESLMLEYVPAEMIASVVGGNGVVPVFIATLVGVPAYLNGYAALPVVDGLMAQGMAPGAAMAFLVAGGVSSLPAAIAVFALARLPVFALYLGFALTGSLAAGLLFGAWV